MAAGRQAAIGAFVLGGIVLAVGAVVFFSTTRLFAPRREAIVVFDRSVGGLSVGAPVTFRGVRVGSVESIVIEYDTRTRQGYIPVTLQLEPERIRISGPSGDRASRLDLNAMVKRGLRAELVTQSFVTGQAEIGLDFSPDTPAVLHPQLSSLPEIPARPSTLERVKEQLDQLPLRELVDTVMNTFASVNKLVDQLNVDLPPIVRTARTTTDRASEAVEQAAQTVSALQGKITAMLDSVTRLANVADQQVSQRGVELQSVLTATRQTMQQANGALADLRGLAAPRGETRVNLDSTLRDLSAAAASFRSFALDLERNPQLLLTGRRP